MGSVIAIGALAAVLFAGWHRVTNLDAKAKLRLKDAFTSVFDKAEDRGYLERPPAFIRDYHDEYPEMRILEENHKAIQEECLKLLEIEDELVDMTKLGGALTAGGVHDARWKIFMFKSGEFIDENCRMAPRTAELLKKIPACYNAFFSVIGPKETLRPHWGYYKGFIRYQLAVVVPYNNVNSECYIRINANPEDNARRDPSLIEKAETYYWHEAEGIMFDDTYLHEAVNGSDKSRVVLFLDVRKKNMPWLLQLYNTMILAIIFGDKSVKSIRGNALVN
jgi:beta-hydroxylase